MFEKLLELESAQLITAEMDVMEELALSCESPADVMEFFCVESEAEASALFEAIVKTVNANGDVRKVLSRDVRKQRATAVTKMSKSERVRRAKKAAKTRKRDTKGKAAALRKRKKAMRKRRQMGL